MASVSCASQQDLEGNAAKFNGRYLMKNRHPLEQTQAIQDKTKCNYEDSTEAKMAVESEKTDGSKIWNHCHE